jgi:hypothetical protein
LIGDDHRGGARWAGQPDIHGGYGVGGAVAMILVLETTVKLVAEAVANLTVLSPVKFVP